MKGYEIFIKHMIRKSITMKIIVGVYSYNYYEFKF